MTDGGPEPRANPLTRHVAGEVADTATNDRVRSRLFGGNILLVVPFVAYHCGGYVSGSPVPTSASAEAERGDQHTGVRIVLAILVSVGQPDSAVRADNELAGHLPR